MKAAKPSRTLEPSVSAAHLAAAISAVSAMDVGQKERICDRIHAEQPNLLASVLALSSLGVSLKTVNVLLNILIVLILAVDKSGQVLATVPEAEQAHELQRLAAMIRFSEELAAPSVAQSFQQTTAYTHEKFLLAYAVGTLERAGLTALKDETAKYPILAGINLVNCIATAKRWRRNS